MPSHSPLFLAAVLCLLPVMADAATISGTVTEAATRRPLPAMVVTSYDASGQLRGTATSDSTGVYLLTLPAGFYRLLAYDPSGTYATAFDGDAESFETSPLRSLNTTLEVRFALRRAGRITGSVSGGASVRSGMIVEIYNLSGTRRASTTSDRNGEFMVIVPPGNYKAVAYDPTGALAPMFYLQARSFSEATPVVVNESAVTSDVSFTLPIAAHVSGTAIERSSGGPLSSIIIYAYTPDGRRVAEARTDQTGRFSMPVAPGEYRFVAADPARFFATTFYNGASSFDRSSTIALGPTEERALQFTLERGVHLYGRVNAPNLTIAAYNLDGTLHGETTSDASGLFDLLVAPGDYKIAAYDPALVYATQFFGAMDFRSAPTIRAMGSVIGLDITLSRGGRVMGTVRGSNGQPLRGATVVAYSHFGIAIASATTAEDGTYRLLLPPGPYRIASFDSELMYATAYTGDAGSFEATPVSIVVADNTTTVDFTLRAGIRLQGQIVGRNAAPIDGIEVFAVDLLGNRVAGAVSRDGAFTMVLLPGTYRMVASDPLARHPPARLDTPVEIQAGRTPPTIVLTVETISRSRSA